MSAEVKKEIQLEIAHALFMDIVGYSKRLINEQRALLDTLNQIVRSTDEFRNAEGAGRLIKIPTGDGMALVFYKSPEEPVECALEISRALKIRPNLPLRMGVHSGPVSGVIDAVRENRGAEGHFTNFDTAVSRAARQSVRDRPSTWRREHPRRQCPKGWRPSAHQRAADSRVHRRTSLG
jgi:class 3 adenylate cyclase